MEAFFYLLRILVQQQVELEASNMCSNQLLLKKTDEYFQAIAEN